MILARVIKKEEGAESHTTAGRSVCEDRMKGFMTEDWKKNRPGLAG